MEESFSDEEVMKVVRYLANKGCEIVFPGADGWSALSIDPPSSILPLFKDRDAYLASLHGVEKDVYLSWLENKDNEAMSSAMDTPKKAVAAIILQPHIAHTQENMKR